MVAVNVMMIAHRQCGRQADRGHQGGLYREWTSLLIRAYANCASLECLLNRGG